MKNNVFVEKVKTQSHHQHHQQQQQQQSIKLVSRAGNQTLNLSHRSLMRYL